MVRWIERDVAKVTRMELHYDPAEMAALKARPERPDPIRRERETLERREKTRPWLLPPMSPTTVEAELARLLGQTPQHWTSPLRRQLLAEGLIEITLDGDGKWTGDRLTQLGRTRLGSPLR